MKRKYIELKALLFAGVLAVSPTLTGCSKDKSEIIIETSTKHFDKGEHVISVPISPKNDIRFKNVQYEYYEGYEPVGISITAHGKTTNEFGGGAILYQNTGDVMCISNKTDENGRYLYLDFGEPLCKNEKQYYLDNNSKEFDVGEHIISVPLLKDNRSKQLCYECHDGYEIIGIATSAFGGMNYNDFGGGVILYKNITSVKCIKDGDSYTSFGVPIEKNKVKTLKK